jgi:formamidopyrimidine-DNA glycosylase
LEIICHGKQIFFFFENQVAFISRLATHGHWYYFDTRQTPEYLRALQYQNGQHYQKFCLNFGREHTLKNSNTIICAAEAQLWFDDSRGFGDLTVTDWAGAVDKLTTLGPDLLATAHPFTDLHPIIQSILPQTFFQKATLELFHREIRSPRRNNMPLCRFLMNQNYFAGIGNYLKSEILYRARINPFVFLGELSDHQISTLFPMVLRTISHAYQSGGLTHGNFLDPDMEKGTFPVYIYKREGQLDPNGYTIRFVNKSESPDGRGTYYVPELQQATPHLQPATPHLQPATS